MEEESETTEMTITLGELQEIFAKSDFAKDFIESMNDGILHYQDISHFSPEYRQQLQEAWDEMNKHF